jgi:hypothetical protein
MYSYLKNRKFSAVLQAGRFCKQFWARGPDFNDSLRTFCPPYGCQGPNSINIIVTLQNIEKYKFLMK